MTLKSLNFEANETERTEIEKVMTSDFLIKVLRERSSLRDQALLIIKTKFQRLELLSSPGSKLSETDLAQEIPFLSTPVKVDQFFTILTQVFEEAHKCLESAEIEEN